MIAKKSCATAYFSFYRTQCIVAALTIRGPSQFSYTLWPIRGDILWFKTGEGHRWSKFKRVK